MHPETSIAGVAPDRNDSEYSGLPLLVSPTRAAAELALSRRTVYDMIAAGELAAVRRGRRLMIAREELLRFAAALEPVGGGAA